MSDSIVGEALCEYGGVTIYQRDPPKRRRVSKTRKPIMSKEQYREALHVKTLQALVDKRVKLLENVAWHYRRIDDLMKEITSIGA